MGRVVASTSEISNRNSISCILNQIAYEAMLRSGERLTQNSLRENLFEFVEGYTSNQRFLSIGEYL